jgi:hypothetical protein
MQRDARKLAQRVEEEDVTGTQAMYPEAIGA